MTDPLSNVPGDERPIPPGAPRRGRRRTAIGFARLLRWWLVVGSLLLLACAGFVAISGFAFDFHPLHVVIQGGDIDNGITIEGLTDGGRALLALGALIVVLVLLMLLPLLLALAFVVVSLVLAIGIVVPVLTLALALVVTGSPIWLVGGAIWLLARRRAAHAAASATIA